MSTKNDKCTLRYQLLDSDSCWINLLLLVLGDAGTTKSFVDAKTFFDGFGGIDYDLVTVSFNVKKKEKDK